MPITFIPAIDLLAGRVVRLHRGQRETATVYADDPAETAAAWRDDGARWLHVVDLDAAFDGPGARQLSALHRIVETAGNVPVELGGGLRDFAAIEEAVGLGVARVVLGTAAVEDADLVSRALARFGVQRIAVAIDEKDGVVKARGWTAGTGLDATEFATRLARLGVKWFLHSAIARDGTLEGPDLPALRRISEALLSFGAQVLCAGGIGSLADLGALRGAAIPNVVGAISGRALYAHKFTVGEATRTLEGTLS